MSQPCRIHLQPDDVRLDITPGRTLLFGLADHGIFLRSDCGGQGRCKKCRVSIERAGGVSEYIEACLYRVENDLTVHIPQSSLSSSCVMDKAPLQLPEWFKRHRAGTSALPKYGVAVDLGTTTIGVYLAHLESAEVLASLAIKNPQAIYGDDVMNRISAITAAGGRTAKLQIPVLSLIDQALSRLCTIAQIDRADMNDLVVAGNPTMIHIFLGENPEPIGVSPYHPVFTEPRLTAMGDLGITTCQGKVRTLPLVSGFIGADTLAAALAVGIMDQPVGTLLVDLGTNGELVLVAHNGIYATSCATGPAFEGASLSCGMQAVAGAIDRVEIGGCDSKPRCRLIQDQSGKGAVKPSGVCGAGIVSAIAACLRAGIIEDSGVFSRSLEIPFLIKDGNGRVQYQLISGSDSQHGSVIALSQKDIRAVQLGKAALRAGIDYLLHAANLKAPVRVLVAGAFGSHIDIGDMISLGMLPDIGRDRIHTVGNAAGSGAVMALCDPESFQLTAELSSAIKIIELSADAGFQKVFIDRLQFPSKL